MKSKVKSKPKVSAIIVAAGKSSRMLGIDKQLARLGGIPSVVHTLEAFERCELIDEIVLVCREENIPELNRIVNYYKIAKVRTIVSGGETRQQSVFAGIREIDSQTDYYCIHDGARPLVSQKIIMSAIEGAFKYQAAAAGVLVKDTIKIGTDGFISDTPNRDSLYAIQTPQIFSAELYNKAVKFAINENKNYTDDCQLIEAIGEKVYISTGAYYNIKLTTPDDMPVAEALLMAMGDE
ncbi:MAG: 2-C-methyl-D-erythritol 4-phosphate cytidylyltransferase [Oscillospiraceae bacterium]